MEDSKVGKGRWMSKHTLIWWWVRNQDGRGDSKVGEGRQAGGHTLMWQWVSGPVSMQRWWGIW